ncbi:importin beta-like SAD2, partial [Tanacetum coccineum]
SKMSGQSTYYNGSKEWVRNFLCPISLELMRDPVIVTSRQTYERSYVQECQIAPDNVIPYDFFDLWGQVDHWVEPYIRLTVERLRTAERPYLKGLLVQVIADALYYNASLTLNILQKLGVATEVFNLWFQMLQQTKKSAAVCAEIKSTCEGGDDIESVNQDGVKTVKKGHGDCGSLMPTITIDSMKMVTGYKLLKNKNYDLQQLPEPAERKHQLSAERDTKITEQIDRDVKRTHPDMHFFSGDSASAKAKQEALQLYPEGCLVDVAYATGVFGCSV